jgi:hypothetical protein
LECKNEPPTTALKYLQLAAEMSEFIGNSGKHRIFFKRLLIITKTTGNPGSEHQQTLYKLMMEAQMLVRQQS